MLNTRRSAVCAEAQPIHPGSEEAVPTNIRLVEGDTVSVAEDYRTVYEKLLAVAWREPCEFTVADDEASHPVTVNPVYIVYFRRQ
jgi:hypothetical protein